MAEAPGEHASHLVALAMQCQNTLKTLLSKSLKNDLEPHQEFNFFSRQLAGFNVWCSKIGVNKPSQRSLDYRLKDLPERRKLIAGLLEVLNQSLQKLRQPESVCEHTKTETQIPKDSDDEGSDSSSWCPDVLSSSDESDTDSRPNLLWTRIEDTIDRLHGHARLIELAGIKHRQARVERFKNKPDQKQVYELFRRIALEKVEHQFVRSPRWMKERIADSFARRRMRFQYLKYHQKKLAFGLINEPQDIGVSLFQIQADDEQKTTTIGPNPEADTHVDQQNSQNTIPQAQDHSVILSATENTRLEMTSPPLIQAFEVAESVASVMMRHGGFPHRPKLQGSDSFTCPYCYLEFPSREAEGISWSQHVIKDFEPYFCFLEGCSEPFEVPNSFEGLLNHIHNSHVSQHFHFEMPDGSDQEFENKQLFERFLEEELQIPKLQWPSLIELSCKKMPFLFETCYFCGGYPDVVENRFPSPATPDAQAEMRKHIKQHMQEIALYLPPVRDDLAYDAPEQDDDSDNAVGTQSHSLDELSTVAWSTASRPWRHDVEDNFEGVDTVGEHIQAESESELKASIVPTTKPQAVELPKENYHLRRRGKSVQSLVTWSQWSEWAYDESQSLMYRVRQDSDGNLDYDYNYEYPQYVAPGKTSPPDIVKPSQLQYAENHGEGKGKDKVYYQDHKAPDQAENEGSQMLSPEGASLTPDVDQAGPSSSGADHPFGLYDDSYEQNDRSSPQPEHTDAHPENIPWEDMDPRYRIHHADKFQPGEIFKIFWSEPLAGGHSHRHPSVSGKHEVHDEFGSTFQMGIRRFIIVANDSGHCTCVPILTYGGKGCKRSGVKPLKHGIIYKAGHKARPLDGEPKLGFSSVQAHLYVDGERLSKESRVNYSKLVTVEHNVKVFFIGSISPGSWSIVSDAVNQCWDEKFAHRN